MLVEEANAQTTEAIKAGVEAGSVYLQQGVLGATCVVFILLFLGACWVAMGLYNDLKAANASALADRDKLILSQQAAATAAEKGVAALEGIKATLETNQDASEDLTKQVELAAQESRHAVSNILTALNGISGRLDRGRP